MCIQDVQAALRGEVYCLSRLCLLHEKKKTNIFTCMENPVWNKRLAYMLANVAWEWQVWHNEAFLTLLIYLFSCRLRCFRVCPHIFMFEYSPLYSNAVWMMWWPFKRVKTGDKCLSELFGQVVLSAAVCYWWRLTASLKMSETQTKQDIQRRPQLVPK